MCTSCYPCCKKVNCCWFNLQFFNLEFSVKEGNQLNDRARAKTYKDLYYWCMDYGGYATVCKCSNAAVRIHHGSLYNRPHDIMLIVNAYTVGPKYVRYVHVHYDSDLDQHRHLSE